MAMQERTRARRGNLGAYDMRRPAPEEVSLGPAGPAPVEDARGGEAAAGVLNILAGIWLIISPFVLGYTGADATWNPIVFGAIVGVFGLARAAAPGARTAWLSGLNMLIGIWLFISAFWLADSSQASWNVAILGVLVFVFAGWSMDAARAGSALRRR